MARGGGVGRRGSVGFEGRRRRKVGDKANEGKFEQLQNFYVKIKEREAH